MIHSMTGYGQAQGQLEGAVYTIEIKAVNNRYFKANIKLAELTAFLESDIEKLLRKSLSRGTINYVLRINHLSANTAFDVNKAAVSSYMEKLSGAVDSANINCTVDLAALLTLPGVFQPVVPDEKTAARISELVLKISCEAIERLKKMRADEGAALAAELANNCKVIKSDLEKIYSRCDIVLEQYHEKLARRVNDLLAKAKLKLDEETLAREVAIFADRSDISEELARLKSHLDQFENVCNLDEVAGRKLDFISQEMLREANTIASKAGDSEIIRCVVDMKCQIEKIKEQVQNIE